MGKKETIADALKRENVMTSEMIQDIYQRYPYSEDNDVQYHPLHLLEVQTGSGKSYTAAQGIALSIKYNVNPFRRQFFIASKKNMLPPDYLIFPNAKKSGSDFIDVFNQYHVDYDKHVLRLSAQMDYFVYECDEQDMQKVDKTYLIGHKYYDRFLKIMEDETLTSTPLAKLCRKKYKKEIESAIAIYTNAAINQCQAGNYEEITRTELGKKISKFKRFALKELQYDLEQHGISKTEEIAKYIQNNEKWLFLLFPDLCKELYDVLIMTVKKFLSSFNPRTDNGANITISISEYLKDSLVYIDEVDSIKKELQEVIIENSEGVDDHIGNDYLTIFTNILKFKPDECDKQIKEAIKRTDKKKYNLNALLARKKKIEPFINYDERYKTDDTISVDRYSIFMYRDSFDHLTFVFQPNPSKDKEKESIYLADDEEIGHYVITREPDMRTKKGTARYKKIIEDHEEQTEMKALVEAIQFYFYGFQYFVNNVALEYRTIENQRRKAQNPKRYREITEEDAFATVIKEFLHIPKMSKEEIRQYKTILSYRHTELKVEGMHINTVDYYQNGFTALSLHDSDDNNARSNMLYLSVLDTPEKILLDWLTRFTVVGMSATAEIPSVLCNFNWSYIKEEIGQENLHTASKEMTDYFKAMNQETENLMKQNNEIVEVCAIGPSSKSVSGDRTNEIESDLHNFEKEIRISNPKVSSLLFDWAAHVINSLPCNAYYKIRYLKMFKVMTLFWNRNLRAFLDYTMAYPKIADDPEDKDAMNADWITTQALFCLAAGTCQTDKQKVNHIINHVKELVDPQNISYRKLANDSIGAVKGTDIGLPDNGYYLFRGRSENFEQAKRTCIECWATEHKGFLMVSQLTASAGQNYQYPIDRLSEESKNELIVTSNRNIANKDKDGRYQKVNIDGVHIEKETFILANPTNGKGIISPSDMAEALCQINDLFRNFEISKGLRDGAINDIYHEVWRRRYNQDKLDSEPGVAKLDQSHYSQLYQTDSVHLAQYTMLDQTVGRTCRTFLDRPYTLISLDADMADTLANSPTVQSTMLNQYERGMMPPKMKYVMDFLMERSGKLAGGKKKELQANRYASYDRDSKKYINALLYPNGFEAGWPEVSRNKWEGIREIVLTLGIRATKAEIEALPKSKQDLIKAMHLYCDVSEVPKEKIDKIAKNNAISDPWHNSRMDVLMQNDDIHNFFNSKGYKTKMTAGAYLMTPYVFQSIYIGAVGEEAGTFICGQIGFQLDNIKDGSLFEKGDRMVIGRPDTLVDFKLVSMEFAKKQMTPEKLTKKILKKINNTPVKNFIVIETILPEGAAREHWDAFNVAEGQSDTQAIYVVPALIDCNGQIMKEGAHCIKAIMQEIE